MRHMPVHEALITLKHHLDERRVVSNTVDNYFAIDNNPGRSQKVADDLLFKPFPIISA